MFRQNEGGNSAKFNERTVQFTFSLRRGISKDLHMSSFVHKEARVLHLVRINRCLRLNAFDIELRVPRSSVETAVSLTFSRWKRRRRI